ncbi:MAG: DUF190 domain-containing protein [Bacillota bacterium]
MQLYNKKKISVIVEKTFSDDVIKLLSDAGVSGYTIYSNISGKGKHGYRNGNTAFAGGILGNVEIVSITAEERCAQILSKLSAMIDSGIVMVVHVIDVQVLRTKYFG